MKEYNRRFNLLLILLGVLVCAAIPAYFHFIAPPVIMPDLSDLQKGTGPLLPLTGKVTSDKTAPVPTPQLKPETPAAKPLDVEFSAATLKPSALKADLTGEFGGFKTALTGTKLAPDMFAFSTLAFDAPVAEFPLVLVGQKSLEWYKTPTGGTEGGGGGRADSQRTIYSKPPPKPPPGPPPTPPPKPPTPPPPEVSTSGL